MMTEHFFHSARMGCAILKTKFFKERQILTIQIVTNYTCNLRCLYCLYSCLPPSVPPSNEIMEFDKIKDILFFLKKVKTLQVSFTGGEPTIHPDYQQIIRLSRKLGFYITVTTNGIESGPILNAGRDATPHLVSVSLDGPPEVNDLYRGKGVWEKANTLLNALKERKVPRAISTVIGKHNCNLDTIKWLFAKAEELKASFSFQLMLPKFDSKSEVNPLAPDTEQMKHLFEGILRIPLRKRRRFMFGDDVLRQLMTWDSLIPYYRTRKGRVCFAGRNFAFISPSYILSPCCLLEDHPWYKTNNLFKVGFKESFKNIQRIPCNDCYIGCNNLRNNILNLNLISLKNLLRMVLAN